MRVVCVIPAYQAETMLGAVAHTLRAVLPDATIIAIDDGSHDATAAVAAACSDSVVRFPVNRGKGAALRAGFAASLALGADAVLTLDADGQHDPRRAPALLDALEACDLAIGARPRAGSAMPVRRRITNRLAAAAVSAIVHAPVADAQSGFRAIRRAVLERVRAEGDRYEFETDFLIRAAHAGFRITTVPVPTRYGAPSHFDGLRDSARVIRTIWRHRAGAFR